MTFSLKWLLTAVAFVALGIVAVLNANNHWIAVIDSFLLNPEPRTPYPKAAFPADPPDNTAQSPAPARARLADSRQPYWPVCSRRFPA